jgi:prepilin-type N-terminal cleavage/methylation domain-containing protein
MKQIQRGFTLVEIAIVLVIIGLLLGGILKGQELITNAKVRNVADQQNAVKAAFFAFQDRFRSLPGDYPTNLASANIPNVKEGGDGNGVIESKATGGGSAIESVLAWNHLANAGFISCSQCSNPTNTAANGASNSPTNAYGGVMILITDNVFLASTGNVTNFKTGGSVPSNVLAEVDRKVDDGFPSTGQMRQDTTPGLSPCVDSQMPINWKGATPDNNCSAAILF